MRENKPFSSFEELDVEQPARRGPRQLELLLGITLVIVIAGWAVWSWWDGQQRLALYRAAQGEAAVRDWEGAAELFEAAAGYADAGDRAAEAETNVAVRDARYESAQEAIAAGNWAAALADLRVVAQIQPGYRDSNTLSAQAEAAIYDEAIVGLVALRAEADPPGLYYQTATGWVYLAASDRHSKMQTTMAPGDGSSFLYDAPSEVEIMGALPGTQTERRLMAATVQDDGQINIQPLMFDRTKRFRYLWGRQGGWGVTFGECNRAPVAGQFLPTYECSSLFYQPAGQLVHPVTLPGEGTWRVADMAPDGSALLLARLGVSEEQGATSTLYLAAPDGANPREVWSTAGVFSKVAWSPDRRFALATVLRPIGGWGDNQQVFLIDLVGNAAPRLIVDMVPGRNGLAAAFLTGARSDQVILVEDTASATTISIAETGGDGAPREVLRAAKRSSEFVWGMSDKTGGLLLGFFQNYTYSGAPARYFDGQGRELALDMSHDQGMSLVWFRDGYLIYMVRPAEISANGAPYNVRAVKLEDASLEGDLSRQLYVPLEQNQNSWPQFALGRGMLAYLLGDELRVKTYDGQVEVQLEKGISSIYDPRLIDTWTLLQ